MSQPCQPHISPDHDEDVQPGDDAEPCGVADEVQPGEGADAEPGGEAEEAGAGW